ncbi:hypothetical protein WEH80_18910 [Actinomycetes bacterium KLBMP 9759]
MVDQDVDQDVDPEVDPAVRIEPPGRAARIIGSARAVFERRFCEAPRPASVTAGHESVGGLDPDAASTLHAGCHEQPAHRPIRSRGPHSTRRVRCVGVLIVAHLFATLS